MYKFIHEAKNWYSFLRKVCEQKNMKLNTIKVFSSSIRQCLKTKVFNKCVLRVMTYGAETLVLTVLLGHNLKVVKSQRPIERAMLGGSLRYLIRNEMIRQGTGIIDIVHRIS